jgi:hypothetical protein
MLTPRQLGRLQTLYAQLARHEIGVQPDRESRLAWVSARLHRQISSFKDLSSADAGWLIDQIQGMLGIQGSGVRGQGSGNARPRLDREQARRAGKDGRWDGAEFAASPQMASAADLAAIEGYLARLGWSREQLDGWLRSARSPLKHKSDPKIVTVSDANRVRWALKGMAKQREERTGIGDRDQGLGTRDWELRTVNCEPEANRA